MSYKNTTPLSQREYESNRIICKYPNTIPVIVESKSSDIVLKKNKFLVPYDVSVSHLLCSLRKKLKLEERKAIFLCYDDVFVSGSEMMAEVYRKFKEKNEYGKKNHDRFLYMNIFSENTFG
jgi:hypothetical protein